MVSHVLVQVLVVVLFLGLVQLGLALHCRNMATLAAVEGARRAALVGSSDEERRQRVHAMLDTLLSPAVSEVTVSRVGSADQQVVEVSVRTSMPLVATWGPQWLRVTGRAPVEVMQYDE